MVILINLPLPLQKECADASSLRPDVRAGCTDFPSRVPIQRDRELLETDGIKGSNGTGIVTVECGSNGANSSSCSF